ncbi:Protein Ment [Manis pentadactyla]|nr:Protein Ment [Manis pentadactyla]
MAFCTGKFKAPHTAEPHGPHRWCAALDPAAKSGALGGGGPRPDYDRDATVSFRFGGYMTRSYPTAAGIPQSGIPPKRRVTVLQGDKVDVAAADRLANPATAELLAATVATGLSQSHVVDEEDGSLEEGVVINARKGNNNDETSSMFPIQWGSPAQGFQRIPRNRKSGSLQASPPPPGSLWRICPSLGPWTSNQQQGPPRGSDHHPHPRPCHLPRICVWC